MRGAILPVLCSLACGAAPMSETLPPEIVPPEVMPDPPEMMPDPPICGAEITASETVVVTQTGAIEGSKSGPVRRFLGVPFAQPPIGDLRWQSPAPMACWTGVRAASAFGPICPQRDEDGAVVGDEDCLTLNVYAPSGAQKAPVLVWIHGGGNTQGASSNPVYDGQELAERRGVVVVSMNYRLGALGFFALSQEGFGGNYGILDQQAALRWVRDNIERFGGDPANVTLFGESAGGQNALVHFAVPGSRGLFSRVIVQSGGIYGTTLEQSSAAMQEVVGAAGCASASDVASCMRAVSAHDLAAIETAVGPLSRGVRYVPVIDGSIIPRNVLDLIASGEHNHVPLIIGTNADETSRMVPVVRTEAEYEAAVTAQFGARLAVPLLLQYPASRFPTPRAALVALTTDTTWTCNARKIARAAAAAQTEPVFRYFFTWRVNAAIGSSHGIEVPFVFGTFASIPFTPDATAVSLADAIQSHWTDFARASEPGASWPRFPAGGDAAIELGATVQPMPAGVRTADCDFFETIAD